jgi:molecular chaperone DnaK (HSP70)
LYKTVNDAETSMSINIYEGEKRYVKYNHLLKQSNIDGLTKRPKGQTKVVIKFDIDVNGILNVEAKEESPDNKGQIVNLIIKNDEVSLNKDEMEQLKKKMIKLLDKFGKINNTKDNDYINIKQLLKGYKEAFEKINEKIKNKIKNGDEDSDEEDDRIIYIKNYYSTLEKFIDKFDKKFDNETILYKYYLYVKDLFQNYIEALQLDLDKGDKEHIFKSIKEYIQIFINNSAGYLNDLIDVLSKMKKKKNK